MADALTLSLVGDDPLLARFPLPPDQQGSKQDDTAEDGGSHHGEIVAVWNTEKQRQGQGRG